MNIKTRKVFYISGYDPRGSAFYHHLYKEEAAKRGKVIGAEIEVSKRQKDGKNYKWQINFSDKDHKAKTEYLFLRWDDLVRKSWIKNPLKLFGKALMNYARAISSGAIKKCFLISWPPAISFIFPFFLILGAIAFAGAIATFTHLLLALPIIYLFGLISNKSNAAWLVRLYNFCFDVADDKIPEYHHRIAEFSETIRAEIKQDKHDEILLVAHSAGNIVLMSVVADIAKHLSAKDCHKLKIVTIGQCIPLLSYIKQSAGYRKEIEQIADFEVYWLDVTAPSDGVCFALEGPFVGICKSKNERLKIISARFPKMFSERKYKEIKKDRLKTHFLYLMAADGEIEFDYFQLTAGAQSIGTRFANTVGYNNGYAKFKLRKRDKVKAS